MPKRIIDKFNIKNKVAIVTGGVGLLGEKHAEAIAEMGGDWFYAAWVNPHLEPGLMGKKFGGTLLKSGLCPVAEEYQKKIMFFKTNYRNLNLAKKNVDLLYNLINKIGN